ncbi:MAG: 4Fe-4S binding protein, partial [Euryarchaeota archaeon]|nr:4Fe-4S binding protein [Euryarchaeota archaeon]
MNNQVHAVRLARSTPQEGACGKTGTWRTFFPIIDREACNSCGMCAMYCPDAVIDEEHNIDLMYCKGCG